MQDARTASGLIAQIRRRLAVLQALRRQAHNRLSGTVLDACNRGIDISSIANSAALAPAKVRRMQLAGSRDEDGSFASENEHLDAIRAAREESDRAHSACAGLERELRTAMIEALEARQLDPLEISRLAGMSACRMWAIYQRHGTAYRSGHEEDHPIR